MYLYNYFLRWIMFKCDYHTHTRFSFDGAPISTPDSLCLSAIERGVTDLAITDHFECNWRAEGETLPYDADAAYKEIMEAKAKYKDKLNLTYGIEIGQANQYPEEAKKLLSSHNYEFVVASIHNLRGAPDFYFWDFKKVCNDASPEYIGHHFERNIDELCEVIDTLDRIDSIAHLTYINRYIAMSGNSYDFMKHSDKIDKLFKKMIARDIALELNLSTLSKGLPFTMPHKEILSLYRECGGRLITIGTDSHSPEQIGNCVEAGFELLRSVGLCDILVVRNGKKHIEKI